jgi:dihydrodipicolinate reductase
MRSCNANRCFRAAAGKLRFPAITAASRREPDRHPKGRSEAEEARSALMIRLSKVRAGGLPGYMELLFEQFERRAVSVALAWA